MSLSHSIYCNFDRCTIASIGRTANRYSRRSIGYRHLHIVNIRFSVNVGALGYYPNAEGGCVNLCRCKGTSPQTGKRVLPLGERVPSHSSVYISANGGNIVFCPTNRIVDGDSGHRIATHYNREVIYSGTSGYRKAKVRRLQRRVYSDTANVIGVNIVVGGDIAGRCPAGARAGASHIRAGGGRSDRLHRRIAHRPVAGQKSAG